MSRVLLAIMLCLTASPTHALELRAGAASVDITPPTGFPMWGYAARKAEPSVGVRDRLWARAVVLSAGSDSIAIVGLDLGRAPTRSSMATIRRLVTKSTGIVKLFLVASHTHHGPVLELDDWPTMEKPYVRNLEQKLAGVIEEAHAKRTPARLGIASAEVPLNRNRHSKRADRPVDRELIVLRLEDDAGQTIAHLVNFAAHPTMLPAKLNEFSPDYPGFMAARVARELGGVCVFLQGAAGDLSPNPPGEPTPEKFGEALATRVIEMSRQLACGRRDIKGIRFREREFRFTSRIELDNPLVYLAYSAAFFPKLIDFYRREYHGGVRPNLTTVLVDGDIGIIGVSGEFFSSHAMQLKRRARLSHLLFLGYCNDYHQYFPTIEAIAEGGYGADKTVAPAEVGAGERMMDRALRDLLELQGKLVPTP